MASLREKATSSHWWACFTSADGKRLQKSTGTADRREAQKIADSYEAAAQRKFTVAHVQRTLRELMADATGAEMPGSSVAEFFRSFVSRRRVESAPATLAFYEYNCRRFLEWCSVHLPAGGKTQLAVVMPAHIEAYRAFRFETVSASTVNHQMKFLRQVFDAAKREGMLLESPCSTLGKIRRHQLAEIRPFTVDEVKLLLAAADDEWRSLILFGLYTGQRLGDLSRLNWKQIDLSRAEVSFIAGKTGRRMIIPLAIPLITRLASTPALDRLGPVHPHACHVVTRDDGKVGRLSCEFKRLMAKCDLVVYEENAGKRKLAAPTPKSGRKPIREISFHSFRHTATSLLRDAGAAPGVSMELIGHSSAIVHQHYCHLGSDTLRRAVSLLPML